jgi:hypothetical protein
MYLAQQYPGRLVRHLLGFPRSLLFRTPADLWAALLRLIATVKSISRLNASCQRRPAESALQGICTSVTTGPFA